MTTALAVLEHQLKPLRPMFDELLRPTGVPAERIIRSVLISCERTPRLLECTPISVIQAAWTGAILGLEADGHTGQGFLVPFKQKGVLKAQWLTGYKGFNTLGARVGLTIDGEAVREGDAFDYEQGSNAYVRHKKRLGAGLDRRIIAAWATATAPNRNPIVVVLDIDEILEVKRRSQAAKHDSGDEAFSPWNEERIGFPAMSGKTAKRRLSRSLPLSAYIAAARVDEAHEEQGKHAFLHPEKGIVIEGEALPIVDAQPLGPPITALERRRFAIKRNQGETVCSSVEEWRGRMVAAIQAIGTLENVQRFRDLNITVMEEYRADFAADVSAVAQAFDARLRAAAVHATAKPKAQNPAGRSSSRLQPAQPPAQGLANPDKPEAATLSFAIAPVMRGHRPDWKATKEMLMDRAALIKNPADFDRLRRESHQTIELMRTGAKPLWSDWCFESGQMEGELRRKKGSS